MPMRLNDIEAVQQQIEEAERNKHTQEVREAQKQWKTINQTANLFATQQENLLSLKQMDNNIEKNLTTLPRNAVEFKKEALKTFQIENKDLFKRSAKKVLDDGTLVVAAKQQREQPMQDSPKKFRLKQRPEYQSELAKLKDLREKDDEIKRNRVLYDQFREQHLTEEQRRKQEEDEQERKRKKQEIENWYNSRVNASDRADIDYDNSQLSQNKSWLHSQDISPGKPKNQYFLTNILSPDALNDREQTESRLTSVFDQQKSEKTNRPAHQEARVDPKLYKAYTSTKQSLNPDAGERPELQIEINKDQKQYNNYQNRVGGMRNANSNLLNVRESYSPLKKTSPQQPGDRIANNQSFYGNQGNNFANFASRGFDARHSVEPRLGGNKLPSSHRLREDINQQELIGILNKSSPGKFTNATDRATKNQIQELVRQQLNEKQHSEFAKTQPVGRAQFWRNNAQQQRLGMQLDDIKSVHTVRSNLTNKTKYTTKSKYQQKILTGSALPPIGMKKEEREETATQQRARKMLQTVQTTEELVDKVLEMLELQGESDEDWPDDTVPDEKLIKNLSFTKMVNEINHREPRCIKPSSEIDVFPLCSSRVGMHSTKQPWRKSNLEILGPGTLLYLKMLKYFGCCFLLFFVLSVPSMWIYSRGEEYSSHTVQIQKLFGQSTIGNLGDSKESVVGRVDLEAVKDSYVMDLQCKQSNQYIGDILEFGLAKRDQFVRGFGVAKHVELIDKCQLGSMTDMRLEAVILRSFNQSCSGKQSCKFAIDILKFLGPICYQDAVDRIMKKVEKLEYGPATIFALAQCHEKDIEILNQFFMTREQISLFVVSVDIGILCLFALSIYRLKYYEELSKQDMKHGTVRIEEFTVQIKDIPLPVAQYKNDRELLAAMLATHFEDIISSEAQVHESMEFDQTNHGEIVAINFGLHTHQVLKHMKSILKTVGQIRQYNKKIKNDPLNAEKHEKEKWLLYSKVTADKDAYYQEKERLKPQIVNAFITFRSMEGKARAMQAYNVAAMPRFLSEYCCCMFKLFKKKKLNRQTFPYVKDVVEPSCIIWENTGHSKWQKLQTWSLHAIVAMLMLGITLALMIYTATYEKERKKYQKSECEAVGPLSQDQAMQDFIIKNQEVQQGLMNCYCLQQKDLIGSKAQQIQFSDGQLHCQNLQSLELFDRISSFILFGIVATTNIFQEAIFNWLGDWHRPADTTLSNFYKTLMIFVVQYLNTAILFILAYNSFMASKSQRERNLEADIFVGPFKEFDERWFLIIGYPIGLIIIFQLFTPHIPLFLKFIYIQCKRCYDRQYSLNARYTRKSIQADYEDLYTGPRFLLQIRYAQTLSIMFLTLSFSSGLPILYLFSVIHFFFAFWTDKYLLLRYYRIPVGFSNALSSNVITLLPLSIVVHFLFGLIVYSNRHLLSSTIIYAPSGPTLSQHFNSQRLGQRHVVIFLWSFICLLSLIALQKWVGILLSSLLAICFKKAEEEKVLSGNLLKDMSYDQLYHEYKKVQLEKQRINLQRTKGAYSEEECSRYLDKYLKIIERNENNMYKQLLEYAEDHVDRIQEIEEEAYMMSGEQKIKVVYDYFSQAIDKNNPLRSALSVDDALFGKMGMTSIQSYDLMDNPKYRNLESMLMLMQETFGYNKDLQSIIRGALSDMMAAGKARSLKKLIGDTVDLDDSIRSAFPLKGRDITVEADNERSNFAAGPMSRPNISINALEQTQ